MSTVGAGYWLRAGLPLLARPWLWPTAGAQAARLARPRWWRHPPFLPLPDSEYVRFRLQTAYGPGGPESDPRGLIEYLEWCRRFSRH